MKKKILDFIMIDNSLAIPVYKQIVQSVCTAIDRGELNQHDRLPSVNSIAEKFSLARGSVFSAYNELRASGIIDSIPGKGYFVTSTQTQLTQNIFLLLARFDAGSSLFYNSLFNNLPKGNKLDIYFHHHSRENFELLIREESSYYNTYVIAPELYDGTSAVLSQLDQKQVLLLGNGYKEFKKQYAGVYQNTEKQLHTLLTEHKQLLVKYKRLFLVGSELSAASELVAGFRKFGKTSGIPVQVVQVIDSGNIRKGDAYLVVDDEQLAILVSAFTVNNWRPGKELGILSFSENVLKGLIGDGISTLSPDYAAMGLSVAEMIRNNDRSVVESSLVFTDRKSF